MLTRQEVNKKGLIDGKDFMYMGGRIYQAGDRFLKNNKEVTVKEIIDQTHFFDEHSSCWHTYMFYDYRCRHSPVLNDPSLAPDPNKAPFEVLQVNTEAGRKAFKEATLEKREEDIYDDYHKIYFFEEMAYYLDNGMFDEELCEFLNQEGSLLLEGMYRYYGKYLNMTVNNNEEAFRFVDSYAEYHGAKKESCM